MLAGAVLVLFFLPLGPFLSGPFWFAWAVFDLHWGRFGDGPFWSVPAYSATLNNMKLVHWPLMGELLHLVQRGGDWVGPQPVQAPPRSTKCNGPSISGQRTNHRTAVQWSVALRF